MTIEDETPKESAVEVTLPDEDTKIAEVELEGKKASVKEDAPKIENKREPAREEEPTVDAREKALQDLKRQYEHQKRVAEAEREARRQAELYARQQTQQIGRAQTEVQDSNLRIILNAIESTEQNAAMAERDYAEAMAAGDYATAAKAQRAMAQAETHLLQLNNGKNKLEEALQQTTEGSVYEPQVPSFEPQIQRDPVDVYAEQLTPKSAQWLREHPDAANKIGKLTRAHADAIEDGIIAESDEYFDFINGRMGYSGNVSRETYAQPEHEAPRQREYSKKSLASAPVSSSSTSVNPTRGPASANTMTLTASEVEFAQLAEPDLPRDKAIEAYARNKQKLIREGKMSA
jgi:hypothetical protein